MQKAKVAIIKCKTYNQDEVNDAVARAIDLCGGLPIKNDSKVLIKPNLLAPKSIEKAVSTHPAVIEGLCNILNDYTKTISIGDSPGISTAKKNMKVCGIDKVAEKYSLQMINFDSMRSVKEENCQFSVDLSTDCLETDHLINIAKFKTHSQMLMTLAVKNLFGCVVGRQKIQWHMRCGTNYETFARLLVDICEMIKPSFNIIDGVIGMEGDGPGNGTPKQMNVILAGANPYAVDYIACKLVGINPDELYVIKVARQLNIYGSNEEDIEILGDDLEKLKVKSFKRPNSYPMFFGPPFMRNFLRNNLSPKPVISEDKCKLCLVCAESCPANAITKDNNRMTICYKECIRCFCCQELCPYKAIDTSQSLIFRIAKAVFNLYGGTSDKNKACCKHKSK